MKRLTINVLAVVVVALGLSYGTRPAHAATEAAKCTITIKKPDGTTIDLVLEGDTCTRTSDGNCTCS
ncbi:MAG TPA: hypothetical protein VFK13_02175 [Gemmatimonadaceae bacterium]|nr:hypothetical protein [Gemmatimonadaceae bacterium]